jgi:hypothetical protein
VSTLDSVGAAGAGAAPSLRGPRSWLRISEEEVSIERRGFRCESARARARLEEVGRSFLRGYHAALADSDPTALAERLDEAPPEFRGFGYEGASMALALLDTLAPWRRRLRPFLAGPGERQVHIAQVGVGWILGRLPLRPRGVLRRLHPVLGWLALDGYGFHEGFFHWPRAIVRQEVPRKLRGYARRGFDQGVGRSLWFVEGTDPERIAAAIGRFAAARHPDLWAGAGLAAAYAGGCEPGALEVLRRLAGPHLPMLAQGAAFAAVAREHGANPAAHTELACRTLAGAGAAELAAIAEETGRDLPVRPHGASEPAFEVWRQRIQSRLPVREVLR